MNRKKIVVWLVLGALLLTGIFAAERWWAMMRAPVLSLKKGEKTVFYVPTGSRYVQVYRQLVEGGLLRDSIAFDRLAHWKAYPEHVKAGRYVLQGGMTANALVNMLRSGDQEPVRVTFNNIRFLPKLAGVVARKLEFDSLALQELLDKPSVARHYGFDSLSFIAMFIPNTYEFFWNTSPEGFLDRMQKEYHKFWNKERRQLAAEAGLSPLEVSILASIVQEETNKVSEMPRMAGVLINRLHKGMKLQADPTARYAYGDFSVKRILTDYTAIDSPYNTYRVKGLPPGPICMPEPACIDAVLHYEKHKYLFYCAKADGSGYHAYARTNAQHNRHAAAYRRYLNRQRIYR